MWFLRRISGDYSLFFENRNADKLEFIATYSTVVEYELGGPDLSFVQRS